MKNKCNEINCPFCKNVLDVEKLYIDEFIKKNINVSNLYNDFAIFIFTN